MSTTIEVEGGYRVKPEHIAEILKIGETVIQGKMKDGAVAFLQQMQDLEFHYHGNKLQCLIANTYGHVKELIKHLEWLEEKSQSDQQCL